MSQLLQTLKFISSNTLAYSHENKERFKDMGLKAMRRLASALKLKEFDASFNAGGIAVAGDLHLMGMFNDEVGIYISISEGRGGYSFLYRTIKHMKDYSGGSNCYFDHVKSDKQVIQDIHRLCRVDPSQLKVSKPFAKRNINPAGKPIEQFTGARRKDYQERYDKAYAAFKGHFAYGNYFRINENSHDRIQDLTLIALAFDNLVVFKGQMSERQFLNTKFQFPSNQQGNPAALIDCYRGEMWDTFAQATSLGSIMSLDLNREFVED